MVFGERLVIILQWIPIVIVVMSWCATPLNIPNVQKDIVYVEYVLVVWVAQIVCFAIHVLKLANLNRT